MGDSHARSNIKETVEVTASISHIQAKSLNLDLNFSATPAEGRLSWNAEDGTMEYGLPRGNVVLQIGQEQLLLARNTTATDMANGEAVYITGAVGQRAAIGPAIASSGLGLAAVPVGLTTEPITSGSTGYVCVNGLVRGIDTNHLVAGGIGYVSVATPGYITTAQPAAPAFTTIIGYCVVSNASSGIFYVRSLAADRLVELSDVDHTTPSATGQHYEWNNANLRFELQNARAYGEIYAYNNATVTSVAASNTYYQFTEWDANGEYLNASPSYVGNHIKVTQPGIYMVNVSLVMKSGGALAQTSAVMVKKNSGATDFTNLHAHRYLAGGGLDEGSLSISGLASLNLNDTLEVWVMNDSNSDDMLVSDCNLTIKQIGRPK